jgi:hypothetical protein
MAWRTRRLSGGICGSGPRSQGPRSLDTRRAGRPVREGCALVCSPSAANATRIAVKPGRAPHCHSHRAAGNDAGVFPRLPPEPEPSLKAINYTLITDWGLHVKGKLPCEDAEMLHPRSRLSRGHAVKRSGPQHARIDRRSALHQRGEGFHQPESRRSAYRSLPTAGAGPVKESDSDVGPGGGDGSVVAGYFVAR